MKKHMAGNSLLLFTTACIWGLAFVSQSKGMEYMGPFTFNGARALIGSLALAIYLLITKRKAFLGKEGAAGVNWGATVRAGLWCGAVFTIASSLQQFGIQYTTVGKAGFITTLYIIFVPIAGLFLGRKVGRVVWFAAGMAAVGLYLLCMTESLSLGSGDILVLGCALFFAAHIMVIDHYAEKADGVIVSCIQFAVCGVVCMAGAFLWEKPAVSQLAGGMGALFYAGVLSCGVAYTLQIVGQKGMNPTVAALILSLESVVATVAGWAAYKIGFLKTDQSMTGRQIAGCAIVFAAVVLVQLPGEWFGGRGSAPAGAEEKALESGEA